MRIAEICSIQLGYTAPGRLEPVERGGVPAVQMRDFTSGGKLNPAALSRFRLPEISSRYFAQNGDVLFRSRGDRAVAVALGKDISEPVIVLLPLVILRPLTGAVDPAYLAWAISQPPSQKHFERYGQGTNIRMFPRSSLDELEISLPPLETQRRIVALAGLAAHERELAARLLHTRHQLVNSLLLEKAQDAHPSANGRSNAL